MQSLLLGYQQFKALLDTGEFYVPVIQLRSFSSPVNDSATGCDESQIRMFQNGLLEICAIESVHVHRKQVALLVEVRAEGLSDLQLNLLPHILSLLRSTAGIEQVDVSNDSKHRAKLMAVVQRVSLEVPPIGGPFALTDVDWAKINQAKKLLFRFTRQASRNSNRQKPCPPSVHEDPTLRNRTTTSTKQSFWHTNSPSLRNSPMAQNNSRGFFASAPELTSEQLAELKKHVVNLNGGRFSSDGDFTTSKQEVQAIFDRHIFQWMEDADQEDLDIVFYSHGGLTNEAWGLATAHHQVQWWKSNGVYPIFFVWETGLLETIWQLIQGRDQGARGIFDGIGNAVGELNDRVWEAVFRTAQVPTLWAGMKSSAKLSFDDSLGGAGNSVLESVFEFASGLDNEVRLHAVGHSAGSIFVSHMIAAANQYEDFPKFETGHFLAPAISNELFRQTLMPLIGRAESDQLKHLSIFTMSDGLEKKDRVGPYGKSLLYLIYHALEAEQQTHILGLAHSLYAEDDIADFFGLVGADSNLTDVVFSKTPNTATLRNRSLSITHGGFDDDAATMESVLRRIIKAPDNQAITAFPASDPRRPIALPTGADQFETRYSGGSTTAPESTYSVPNSPVDFRSSAKGKHALTIGIDNYPVYQDRLSGCEYDAGQWGKWFDQAGFDTKFLPSAEATRAGIVAAIESLIKISTPGDVVAIQYAGHGTQVPDLNGDEKQGDTGAMDEALVPVDYAQSGLLRDDDLGALCNRFKEGVSLTLIMDCCCSGSVSRFFMGKGHGVESTGSSKPRCLPATQAMIAADLAARSGRGGTRANFNPYTGTNEILFAACQSNQYAYETNGSGDFTRIAIEILSSSGGNLSCAELMQLIRQAFGLDARQTPGLWCDSSLENSGFLGAVNRSSKTDQPTRDNGSALNAIRQIKRIANRFEG